MDRLYDDHRTDSSPTQVTTMAGEGQANGGCQQCQQSAGQPGGLDASSSTTGQNPVSAAVEASAWTHDDILLALTAISTVAWVATTYYMVNNS